MSPPENRKSSWLPQPFAGLRGLSRGDWQREISAGITLAALIIPLNIGYAQVAGLPPTVGLYAAIIPLLVFALFTTSRHVVGSPDASIAALVGAALMTFAMPGDPLRVQYAQALALMCGLLFLAFWYFRLAFLANFLSRAVLAGFISGLGIEVFTSQVRKMLGVAAPVAAEAVAESATHTTTFQESVMVRLGTEGYFVELFSMLKSIPQTNLYSLAIGVAAICIIRSLKKFAPRVPGALVALILLTSIVALGNLQQKGVGVLGEIPSGPPKITAPGIPLLDYLGLLPGAMAIVAITLCEGLLLVRQYSRKHGYKADGNQVLFAYGVANLAAGMTGALVCGNSPSRSAAMDNAGSRSQWPSVIAAGTIALVMLCFTNVLAFLPNAALAGIVANAVLSLIGVQELRELYWMRRSEFWIAMVCLLSVLALGPLQAVIIAFLLATIDVVWRASRPGTWVLQAAEDGSHFIPTKMVAQPDESGVIIYRFGSPLYFANANLFLEEVEKLVTQSPAAIRAFVLDAEAISDIDTTGAEVLHQVLDILEKAGITFALARANPQLPPLLTRYRLLDSIGQDHLYPTNRHAITALRHELKR